MIEIDDFTNDLETEINGLCFRSNTFFEQDSPSGYSKLASSVGPLVSDYVTHQANFHYDSYGIHIGQDDRLTFFGGNGKAIIGYFIDCRRNSSTFGLRCVLKYRASPKRRLVIPRGVAHSFDNLAKVVTRDEPVWYF